MNTIDLTHRIKHAPPLVFACVRCKKHAIQNHRCSECVHLVCKKCHATKSTCDTHDTEMVHDALIEPMITFSVQNSVASCTACAVELKYSELLTHILTHDKCKVCNEFYACHFEEHQRTCRSALTCCPCRKVMPRHERYEHMKMCPVQYKCSCDMVIAGADLDKHREEVLQKYEKTVAEIKVLKERINTLGYEQEILRKHYTTKPVPIESSIPPKVVVPTVSPPTPVPQQPQVVVLVPAPPPVPAPQRPNDLTTPVVVTEAQTIAETLVTFSTFGTLGKRKLDASAPVSNETAPPQKKHKVANAHSINKAFLKFREHMSNNYKQAGFSPKDVTGVAQRTWETMNGEERDRFNA